MEHPSLEMLIFLVTAGFLASFIDSVVGGGGLISVPALLLTGLPPGMVLGTNKLGGTASSLTSSTSFLLSGKINKKLVMWLFPLSLLGSVGGAFLVKLIPGDSLRPIVVVLLILVTLYTLFKKNWGSISTYRGLGKRAAWLSAVVALVIGLYDGFFGPGTGSFLIFAFLLLGFDFVGAAGNAKVLNLASNLGSLVTFACLGYVNYYYGIPMAISMVVGALIGSQFAIRRGAAYVKPLFILISTLLIGKQLWDFII
ncbi:sulfite exporter TauE/SafE family protein [Paenibacillus koleovorans]|uniref:sulfite exporter TauE/SafE family protein n=1 Tax=Paenibacillus koleovorans TaxID=121608 RepID=UPI000FDB72A8|nr:TSUP family transporter [Paenibacillus koleovorans]